MSQCLKMASGCSHCLCPKPYFQLTVSHDAHWWEVTHFSLRIQFDFLSFMLIQPSGNCITVSFLMWDVRIQGQGTLPWLFGSFRLIMECQWLVFPSYSEALSMLPNQSEVRAAASAGTFVFNHCFYCTQVKGLKVKRKWSQENRGKIVS